MVRFVLALVCAISALATSAVPAAAQDTATIVLREHFPFVVNWEVADQKGQIEDKTVMAVPVGKAYIAPASYFGGEYASMFIRYRLNGKLGEMVESKAWEGTLKKGDILEVILVGIAAPVHAVVVPYKDGTILVSVVHPIAEENPAGFKGKEEFKSTAMIVAKNGYKKVARKVAKDAIDGFGIAQKNRGKYRDDQQISVLFPMKGTALLPGQAAGTEDELAEAIEIALRTIAKQNLDGGTTFGQEIEKAEGLLKIK